MARDKGDEPFWRVGANQCDAVARRHSSLFQIIGQTKRLAAKVAEGKGLEMLIGPDKKARFKRMAIHGFQEQVIERLVGLRHQAHMARSIRQNGFYNNFYNDAAIMRIAVPLRYLAARENGL